MPHLVSIAYTPLGMERRPATSYARASLQSAVLLAGRGIDGDLKATRGERQLNVMLAEQVAELHAEGFRTQPGELGEQLVVAGLPPEAIQSGVQLRLGLTAVVELGELRTGCSRFAHIQGKPPAAAESRLGYLARVVAGGRIDVGAEVALVRPPAATTAPA